MPTDNNWIGVHSGHSQIASDGYYVESEGEWSGVHTSYDDVFIPSEPEPEPIPDFKTMWAAVHAPEPSARSLDDALISSSGNLTEGGTLSFSMELDERVSDQALPRATTDVQVSIPGTGVSSWQSVPAGSVTVDLSLGNLPPGLHTVEVQAYRNGRVIGTTQFTISVAGKSPALPTDSEPAPEEAPSDPDWQPEALEQSTGPSRLPPTLQSESRQMPELDFQEIEASQRPTRRSLDSLGAAEESAPVVISSEVVSAPVPLGGTYLAGQVMASGLGVELRSPGAAPSVDVVASVIPVVEVGGAALDGHGDGRRPQRSEEEAGQEPA